MNILTDHQKKGPLQGLLLAARCKNPKNLQKNPTKQPNQLKKKVVKKIFKFLFISQISHLSVNKRRLLHKPYTNSYVFQAMNM